MNDPMTIDVGIVGYVVGVVAVLAAIMGYDRLKNGRPFWSTWFEVFSKILGALVIMGALFLLPSTYPYVTLALFWSVVLLVVGVVWFTRDRKRSRKSK